MFYYCQIAPHIASDTFLQSEPNKYPSLLLKTDTIENVFGTFRPTQRHTKTTIIVIDTTYITYLCAKNYSEHFKCI